MPSNGELILPLPVLKVKLQLKNSVGSRNTVKPDSGTQSPKAVAEKEQKLSTSAKKGENSMQESSSKSNSVSPAAKKAKDLELCVVNREKSFFHSTTVVKTDKTTDKKSKNGTSDISVICDPIEISDDDLDFGSYDEMKYHKRKKSVPMVVVSDSD